MDSPVLIDIVAQLPVVGAVVVVIFYFLREMDRRDTVWRSFLNDQNERDEKSSEKLANAIDKLREQVARNTAIMIIHDAAVRGKADSTEDINALVKKILE